MMSTKETDTHSPMTPAASSTDSPPLHKFMAQWLPALSETARRYRRREIAFFIIGFGLMVVAIPVGAILMWNKADELAIAIAVGFVFTPGVIMVFYAAGTFNLLLKGERDQIAKIRTAILQHNLPSAEIAHGIANALKPGRYGAHLLKAIDPIEASKIFHRDEVLARRGEKREPPKASPPSVKAPRCDTCGRQLEYAGNPLAQVGDENAHTWRGTVCTSCGHVFCHRCNVVDPVPCPKCNTTLKPAMLIYLETAAAQSQPPGGEVEFYQYNMASIPTTQGRCSDRQCPCPETPIPRGSGYLYISAEAVAFMKGEMSGAGAGVGGILVIGSMPVLTCEQGATLRGIDMEVAAEDAKRWWETGKVPLRPTPMVKGR